MPQLTHIHWFAMGLLAVGCATGAGTAEPDSDDDGASGPSSNAGPTVGAGGMSATNGSATNGSATNGSGGMTTSGAGPDASAGSAVSSSANSVSSVSASSATASVSTASSSVASSSSGGCTLVDVVTDGGFEQGPGGTAWTASSSNFVTPICDVAGCGTGSGMGPNLGTYWSWFGGVSFSSAILPEIASVSQTVVIPVGMATLEFRLEVPVCDSFLDFMEARIDGQVVFSVDGGSALCGQAGYTLQSVNVSAFADGNAHTLQFYGEGYAALFTASNFMLDDVALMACL